MLENSDFMEVTVKFGLFCHPMEIRSSAPDLHYIIKRPTMINFDHQILTTGWCVLLSCFFTQWSLLIFRVMAKGDEGGDA